MLVLIENNNCYTGVKPHTVIAGDPFMRSFPKVVSGLGCVCLHAMESGLDPTVSSHGIAGKILPNPLTTTHGAYDSVTSIYAECAVKCLI